jgi:hypothetical protein
MRLLFHIYSQFKKIMYNGKEIRRAVVLSPELLEDENREKGRLRDWNKLTRRRWEFQEKIWFWQMK